MVKHTKIIRRLLPTADELFEFDHFVGLALKELTSVFHAYMSWTVSFERFPNISVFTYVLEELPFFQITSDYLILFSLVVLWGITANLEGYTFNRESTLFNSPFDCLTLDN